MSYLAYDKTLRQKQEKVNNVPIAKTKDMEHSFKKLRKALADRKSMIQSLGINLLTIAMTLSVVVRKFLGTWDHFLMNTCTKTHWTSVSQNTE